MIPNNIIIISAFIDSIECEILFSLFILNICDYVSDNDVQLFIIVIVIFIFGCYHITTQRFVLY